ncbi:MAG: isochorismatase family protein [Candidatus Komeilibacteria bacterium]|nr:isochorismatase family protein [Candidatus Komeilibacteria bacterium]
MIGRQDALVVIDATLTFMPGGGLAVQGGDKVIAPIKRILPLFPEDKRVFTLDVHEVGHISFASSYVDLPNFYVLTYEEVAQWTKEDSKIGPKAKFTVDDLKLYLRRIHHQTLWPDHGLGKEAGKHQAFAEYDGVVVRKGLEPTRDSYSAVRDNAGRELVLLPIIKQMRPKKIFVCGLVYRYCVGWTALDLADLGYQVTVVKDATQDLGDEAGHEEMNMFFKTAGVRLTTTRELIG